MFESDKFLRFGVVGFDFGCYAKSLRLLGLPCPEYMCVVPNFLFSSCNFVGCFHIAAIAHCHIHHHRYHPCWGAYVTPCHGNTTPVWRPTSTLRILRLKAGQIHVAI